MTATKTLQTDVIDAPSEDTPADVATHTPVPGENSSTLIKTVGKTGRAMILTGTVIALFVAFQVWGSNFLEAQSQTELVDELEASIGGQVDVLAALATQAQAQLVEGEPRTEPGAETSDGNELEFTPRPAPIAIEDIPQETLAALFPEDGTAVAQIAIPAIDLDKIVVSGTAATDLRRGPGHYSATPLPGSAGNAAIAGHRTTYGAPFNRIDELEPGDLFTVTNLLGEFTYEVQAPADVYSQERIGSADAVGSGHIIVQPSASWVLNDFGDDRITLTACHPKLSSRQRIIVTAVLIDDPVIVPTRDEVLEAQPAAIELASENIDEDGVAETSPSSEPATSAPVSVTESSSAMNPTEGLTGDSEAVPVAVAWISAATLIWWALGRIARVCWVPLWHKGLKNHARFVAATARVASLPAVAWCLWIGFEAADRAMPAV